MSFSTLLLAATLLGSSVTPASTEDARGKSPKFYVDDPLWVDMDNIDTPVKPAVIELSDTYDRFAHILRDFGEDGGEALNVNTVDEVPDSSWFTNRHGRYPLGRDELVAGPNAGPGPELPWTIVATKTEGLTPGFIIEDALGRSYVVKLDARSNPELNSASEIIATKILHAIGYNVPANYLEFVSPDELRIGPGAVHVDEFGDRVSLTEKLLDRILTQAARAEDGRLRVVASRFVEGEPIGPFRYYGTRSDDPNDVFPHEHRRELRGLRVFAAWLNHDDTRAQNTLDSWVEEEGAHYVRHYLIDFGSTLGSGTVDLQLPNLGFHYWLDAGEVKKAAVSFGLYTPKYRAVSWPEEIHLRGVGRFESSSFDPAEWKNDYPNPAFVRLTPRDGFWAAKILLAFTEEDLRAIVRTGQYSQPEAEDYVWRTLVERQKKTARYFLNQINPLGDFQIVDDELHFRNLAEAHGLGPGNSRYQLHWQLYDNRTGDVEALTGVVEQSNTRIRLPLAVGLSHTRMLVLEIDTSNSAAPNWNRTVRVYMRSAGSGIEVVGIERESE